MRNDEIIRFDAQLYSDIDKVEIGFIVCARCKFITPFHHSLRDIDVINENLTLNARRCEASITTMGSERSDAMSIVYL